MIVASNFPFGVQEAFDVLRRGGSALDAVEVAARAAEDEPTEHSVGFSGYPNILGQVELDASIMDGRNRSAGAVAGLRRCRQAIAVARRVMQELPHVLLVGDGADRFAAETGFPQEELVTDETRAKWTALLARHAPGIGPEALPRADLRGLVRLASDPEKPRETVDCLAVDGKGDIASGTSTSGWAWKYPGRAGDSPIIGSGNYADNRYGAATCTGRGEMAIRCGTARSVVLHLAAGRTLEQACTLALQDLATLEDRYFGWVDIIALSPRGELYGASWESGRIIHYMADGMSSPGIRARHHVPLRRGSA